jgi:hypothetical protein
MKQIKHTIKLLDLGRASALTKGGRGFSVEDIDCIIRGLFQCGR